MSRHVISVCIFCFICATHSPCASHAATGPRLAATYHRDYRLLNDDQPSVKLKGPLDGYHKISKRESGAINDTNYVRKLFTLFGDGDSLTIEGFRRLVEHLKETEHEANSLNDKCKNRQAALFGSEAINETTFLKACPALLYDLVTEKCPDSHTDQSHEAHFHVGTVAWLCSIGAVILISACGVLALAIIPVMQKWFYQPLIQFLVALAVGTLAGDALLHLLPHAMSVTHLHDHQDADGHDSHDENTKKGCVAMLGLTFFFVMERLILLAGKWRKGKNKRHTHSHVTVIDDRRESVNAQNNTQCMDKYNPFPYCYKDITNNPNSTYFESTRTAMTTIDPGSNSDAQSLKKSRSPSSEKLETNQNTVESASELVSVPSEANKMLQQDHRHDEDYTVILREHSSDHHGHSHKHGHVHAAPQNFSSVAWMVIMGDGLHNFTDGMAIGAAFSGGIAGGFSTTVAVFCHELPHELGDFAMLLKAGMSVKQALFYNILSSVFCILGNVFGLYLGNTEYASSWLFAAAAGMFIYIALVDMIPELSSAHEDEGNLVQCILHLSGLLSGFGIMALIAMYEHDLKTLFNDPE